jgi:hypothetical protein
MHSGASSLSINRWGAEGRKGCAVCGNPASIHHRLKIASGDRSWIVPLCLQCENEAARLSAFGELLWFQARGVDVLALASRRRLP